MNAATTVAALLAWVAVAARSTGWPFALAVLVLIAVAFVGTASHLRGR
jgi:hypothetical protein